MIYPVILCGGSGSRLWPLSRINSPKQFVSILDDTSLFIRTVKRFEFLSRQNDFGQVIIVTNENQAYLVKREISKIKNLNYKIIIEPTPRNTAGAVCAVSAHLFEQDPDSVLIISPSDHEISDNCEFEKICYEAIGLAKQDFISTFGLVPTRPETGYGYIESGEYIHGNSYKVLNFIEKPSKERAISYLQLGNYYWNSGIFVFKSSCMLQEFKNFKPEILKKVQYSLSKIVNNELDHTYTIDKSYDEIEEISLDFAIMEKTKKAAVVKSVFSWTDLGSWKSIYDFAKKDENNNIINGDVVALNTKNCLINNKSKLIATNGIKDLAIINTKDALLITSLEESQDVKKIFNTLEASNRLETKNNAFVTRPWGGYESLIQNGKFQVKQLVVDPGEQLSLQKHFHRSEHWIVVSGIAEIQLGETIEKYTENQSVYIPVQMVHRLRNPGGQKLIVIEIQYGDYLGEDDIERLEDKYHRI